jgi:hypothetical protein
MHQNAMSSQYPLEEVPQPAESPSVGAVPEQEQADARSEQPTSARQAHHVEASTFASPGLTPGKRYGTAIMLFVLGVFVIGVVWYQGGSVIVSAILGALLIAGFVWYLRLIAPAPFTLSLTAEGLTRQEQGQEPLVIPWGEMARVKEEQFPNGKIIGVMIYARSKSSVYRALVLWRDDLPQFDAFRQALKASTLPETAWQLETVHE